MAPETFAPRRASPNAEFVYNDYAGQVHLRADEEGIVQPKNANEERIADELGLPVARKVLAEQKAASAAKES